jgi:hypothetical protein
MKKSYNRGMAKNRRNSYNYLGAETHPGDTSLPASGGAPPRVLRESPAEVDPAPFFRRLMRQFFYYWFIAVPKLTKAQAFALFYRFVRYASWSYNVEWGEQEFEDEEGRPTIHLDEVEGRRFAEALANPPEPCEALKKAAEKYQGDDVV